LVVILLLSELFLRQMDTSYKIKNQQLMASADSIELLILGNSHENYGLAPRQFSVYAFNLAQVGQSLYFDKRIALGRIDRLKKLKYVLLGIDFHSLYFSNFGILNLCSYYGYGVDGKNTMPLLSGYSYLAGYGPGLLKEFIERSLDKKYKTIKALDVESGVNFEEPFEKGFLPLTNDTDLQDTLSQQRAGYFNHLVQKSEERGDIMKDLEDFITVLKGRNITPILITMPCYGPFRELLDHRVQEQNKTDILAMAEKFQIAWWDYFELPLSADYFFDCDHLNGKGAAVFSDMVNKRIEALKSPGH
jgi:hypothetical protein